MHVVGRQHSAQDVERAVATDLAEDVARASSATTERSTAAKTDALMARKLDPARSFNLIQPIHWTA